MNKYIYSEVKSVKGILLCDDIFEIIGKYLKKIRDKENVKFHCSLLQNPDCLGGWIYCYNSARFQRHIYLLEELQWRVKNKGKSLTL